MKTVGDLSNISPIELMSQLDRKDSLFFDSSGNIPKSYTTPISILATNPSEIITGNISDTSALRDVMLEHEGAQTDLGYPQGGLAGWIDYDGSFTFGVNEDFLAYDHNLEQWLSEPRQALELQQALKSEIQIGQWASSMSEDEFVQQ